MFIVDENREIVGYSAWPWDSVYTPMVGCFRDGQLVATAACDLLPQPGLDGPEHAWWFRIRVDRETTARLEQGDMAVRIMRLEDGVLLQPAFAVKPRGQRALRVEELVALGASADTTPLTGFTAFLKAPVAHQLGALYLDVLGRGIDPSGLAHYRTRLATGTSILQVRADLIRGGEFQGRSITVSSRIGSLITAPIWSELLEREPIGETQTPMPEIRLSRYRDLDDAAFIRALHRDCFGKEVDDGTAAWLTDGIGKGREWVASVLVRDAARANLLTDFAG